MEHAQQNVDHPSSEQKLNSDSLAPKDQDNPAAQKEDAWAHEQIIEKLKNANIE